VPDSRTENKLLLRIFVISLLFVLVASIGYLLVGERIIKHFYDGASIPGLVPARHPDGRTLEEYTAAAAGRFWQNTVLGIPLTLLCLFLMYRLYKWLLLRPSDLERRSTVPEFQPKFGAYMAGALYTLLALVYFYPCLKSFAMDLIGPPEDNMACLWTLCWGSDHLFAANSGLAQINVLFYPEGTSFLYHAWSFYNLYLFWGLKHLFGPVTSYNLLILHSFPLAGIGGYFFTRYFTKNHWLALLGGFLFAFCPAHVIRSYHHMNIATIQFIPFFLLFYIKAVRRESRLAIVWCSLSLLLCALVDWNYLLYGIWFMIFAYLYLAIRRRKFWLPDVVMISAVALGTTLLIVSPWLVPMIRVAVGGSVSASGHNQFVVDLAALVTPNPLHLFGQFEPITRINQTFSAWPHETTGYLGLVSLAIVIFMGKEILSEIVKLLLGGVSFLLMALGAQPHFLGLMVPVLTPGRIVPMLPLLANSRAPSRNIIFVYLFLAVIVSAAVGRVWEKLAGSRLRTVIVTALVCLLVLDYFTVCTDHTAVSLPACYGVLPRGTEQYGLLDLPLGYEPTERYMMYQSMHGLPIVEGWVSRKTNPTLLDRLDWKNLAIQKSQLVESKVRYVILHKQYLPSDSVNPASYNQTYRRIYDDSLNSVFETY
jgi:hypothetical protein